MHNNMFYLYMCIYCYDLVIINSSFSTETELSDLLFPYLNGVGVMEISRVINEVIILLSNIADPILRGKRLRGGKYGRE